MIEPETPLDETARLKSLHSLKVLDTQPEERYDRITRLARRIFDVPIALVSLVDADRQWFKSRAGLAATETPRNISFCGHAINGTDVFVVEDACSDQRFCDNPLVAGEPDIRFYAGYPLRAPGGARLGTLCVIDREQRQFSDEDVRTLTQLGEMVEAELCSDAAATTDVLTGLVNRRGFHLIMPVTLGLCRRSRLPVSMFLLDIDGLERINEAEGREEGDRLLEQIARCLLKSCREIDIVARIGGDEFGGLLVGSGVADPAPALRRRLDRAVEAVNRNRDPARRVRVSIGCVTVDTESNLSLDSLLRQADVALYQQKSMEPRSA